MSARDEWMEAQTERKEYVLGFCFMHHDTEVVLICKNKPEWQRGQWNGIGGKIEAGENPMEAMIREWQEETDSYIVDWHRYVTMIFYGAVVHVFKSHVDRLYVRSATDEPVTTFTLRAALDSNLTIPNLKWLIPMALYDSPVTQPHWKGAPTIVYP